MAPRSEADVVFDALRDGWDTEQVVEAVRALQLDALA